MTLYNLTAEFLQLADRLTDEPTDADLEAIGASEEAIRQKAEGYVAVWRNLEAEAEAMKAESRRLWEAATKREDGAERLKKRVAWSMDMLGIERLPTALGRLSVQNASMPSIKWEGDMEDMPEEFQKVEIKLDYDAARKALKAGPLPAGFRAIMTRSIRVR